MKNKERFTFVKIIHFDNCFDCPYRSFHDDDNDCTHDRCDKLNEYIEMYLNKGAKDFRNEDGVLDGCPFLENKIIAEES